MAKDNKKLVQAITSQEENFAQWYTDICVKAELVEYSKGYSVVRNGQKREGVVMRNVKSNISFKVINPDFLLAEKD